MEPYKDNDSNPIVYDDKNVFYFGNLFYTRILVLLIKYLRNIYKENQKQ